MDTNEYGKDLIISKNFVRKILDSSQGVIVCRRIDIVITALIILEKVT